MNPYTSDVKETRTETSTMRWLRLFLHIGLLMTFASRAGNVQAQTSPLNDSFAEGTVISGTSATVSGSNVGATKEAGEPNHANNAGGKSVWWTWTTPADGKVTLDTTASSFDTLLAVYTGTSVSNLASVAYHDDISRKDNFVSRLGFTAVAGMTYQIAVDGYAGDNGTITLSLWLGPLPPRITGQPAGRAVAVGTSATLSVAAIGETPFSYQWFKDEGSLADATNASYVISAAQAGDAGTYRVVVTNSAGTLSSSNAVITVAPVVFTTQPQDAIVTAGYGASFSVAVSSASPVSYQWQKDSDAIPGATGASYSIATADYGHAGSYSVVATNAAGSASSSNALMTVIAPYTFVTLAGLPGQRGTNDGVGSAARFADPHGITLDSSDNVYVTEIGAYSSAGLPRMAR